MAQFAIIHEAPASPGISELEVARVEADSEESALVTFGPIMAAIQDGEFERAIRYLSMLVV